MMNTYRLAYTRERAAYKQRIGMKIEKIAELRKYKQKHPILRMTMH